MEIKTENVCKIVREHAECKTAGLLPGDFVDLSVVHGAEDRGVSHSFPDPQLDADAAVEEEHGGQRQQEQRHHDEGGVNLTVQQWMPALLTAHVMMIVQEVVLYLRSTDKRVNLIGIHTEHAWV